MAGVLGCFVGHAPLGAQAGVSIKVRGALPPGVSQPQWQSFVSDVQSKLPAALNVALANQGDILIRFSAADPAVSGVPIPPQPGMPRSANRDQALGHASRSSNVITLNGAMAKDIAAGSSGARPYGWGHRNTYRLAVGTLIHELSHRYDYQKGLSKSREFRNIIGWKDRGLTDAATSPREQRLALDNSTLKQSPDDYEFKSPEEAFAVNMEYYLTDPDFQCRRPTLYRYFAQHVAPPAIPLSNCQVNTKLPYITAQGIAMMSLNPDRIHELQYLLAGPGKSFLSRNGHTALRAIVCAPDRAQVGPECENDVAYHVALGDSAMVAGKPNPIATLLGKYPSRLIASPMSVTTRRYNDGEFRPVGAQKLNLTAAQKKDLVYRLIEEFWTKEGKYRMLSDNCATLMGRTLTTSVPALGGKKFRSISPKGIAKELQGKGLLLPAPSDDPKAQVERGLLFESKMPQIEESLASLRSLGFNMPPDMKAMDFVSKLSVEQRKSIYRAGIATADPRTRFRAAMLYKGIESVIAYRLSAESAKKSYQSLELPCKSKQGSVPAGICADYVRLKKVMTELQPQSFVATESYGIPLESELRPPPPSFFDDLSQLQRRLEDYLSTQGAPEIKSLFAQSKGTVEFIDHLEDEMNRFLDDDADVDPASSKH